MLKSKIALLSALIIIFGLVFGYGCYTQLAVVKRERAVQYVAEGPADSLESDTLAEKYYGSRYPYHITYNIWLDYYDPWIWAPPGISFFVTTPWGLPWWAYSPFYTGISWWWYYDLYDLYYWGDPYFYYRWGLYSYWSWPLYGAYYPLKFAKRPFNKRWVSSRNDLSSNLVRNRFTNESSRTVVRKGTGSDKAVKESSSQKRAVRKPRAVKRERRIINNRPKKRNTRNQPKVRPRKRNSEKKALNPARARRYYSSRTEGVYKPLARRSYRSSNSSYQRTRGTRAHFSPVRSGFGRASSPRFSRSLSPLPRRR